MFSAVSNGSLTPSMRAVPGISCPGPMAPAEEIRCGLLADSTCTMATSSPRGSRCRISAWAITRAMSGWTLSWAAMHSGR